MIKFIRFIFVITILSFVSYLATASSIIPIDKIVALVNNEIITNVELMQYKKLLLAQLDLRQITLPEESILKKQILNQMILEKLQLQLAMNAGIEVDSLELNAAMQTVAHNAGLTLTAFQQQLTRNGIALTTFKTNLQNEIILEKLRDREIGHEIVISNADIDGFLNSPLGQDQSGAEYHLRHILLTIPEAPTPQVTSAIKQQAINLVTELKAGADFAKMAVAKSAGQQALNGGDLAWRKISEIPTLFIKYVPTMAINDIVGPIPSANGFHIIKLVDKRIGNIKPHLETHVRQIFLKPNNHASDLDLKNKLLKFRQQILQGKDFATIAKRNSEELNTADNGGDLGWVDEKAVLPKFYQQMQLLKNSEISQPFKTELGWHLIQVLDRRSQVTSIAAARNKVKAILRDRKYQELLEAWLKRLKDNAKIEILL